MKMEMVLLRVATFLAALVTSTALSAPLRLIPQGDFWKYLDNGTDQGTAWRDMNFDDSHWASGPAQLGYGDGDEATIIGFGPNGAVKYPTTYFRRAFVVSDFMNPSNLVVRLLRDDGAVVYLNGVEVFRSNMPQGPITYTSLAPMAAVGADETTNFHAAVVPVNLLNDGLNILAVEVHQNTVTSADLSFDLELLANVDGFVPLPTVSIEAIDSTASEISPLVDRAEDPGIFRLYRNGPTNDALWVDVMLTGTAQNGLDYLALSNRVQIPAGAASMDVFVNVLDDTLVEGTESVQMRVARPACADNSPTVAGCYGVGVPAATISILDDDQLEPPPGILVATGSVWKYLDNGSDQGSAWRHPTFDDSSWASGPAQLGYGDGDEATVVSYGPDSFNKHITTYFRHSFEVANPAVISNLLLRVLRDDGVVVYLNGVEIFRNNLPDGAIAFDTLATLAVDENAFIPASIPATALVSGRNVVAAEIHQVSRPSSDIGFDLELTGNGDTLPPERPTIDIVLVDPQAVEPGSGTAGRPGRLLVRRHGNPNVDLQVLFSLSGTAALGVDYTTASVPISMPAGVIEIPVNVIPQQDTLPEGTETVVFTLQPPNCVAIEPAPPECYLIVPGSQATVFISDPPSGTNQPPANTVVARGSVWRYLDNGSDQGTAWRHPSFDDSAWASGAGQLGYGDGDESTIVNSGPEPLNRYVTTYFRHAFALTNTALLSNVTLRVLRDDGVVVYLNGIEVFRNNMPAGEIAFNTLAASVAGDENAYLVANIPPNALVAGRNVLAAEVHQVNGSSSDLGFDLELAAGGLPEQRTIVDVFAIDRNASETSLNSLGDFGAFVIRRRNNVEIPLEVTFSLAGTAENGVDYNFVSNRVFLPPGIMQRIVSIQPRPDMVVEGTETVVLTIEAPVCIAISPPPPECYLVGPSNQATVFITDGPSNTNQPPTVSMFAPTDGANFPAGSNIQLGANANDPEGAAVTVEFFSGTNRIGSAPGPTPGGAYWITWSNVLAGDYSLTARAMDSSGRTAVSTPVQIRVIGDSTHETTLIAFGSVWRYLDNGTDQGTAWRLSAFDDSSWASGPGQLGYGDGDEATVVGFGPEPSNKFVTTYFRHSFELNDPAGITRLIGKLRQDDGSVVYLNGVEIFRSNMQGGFTAYNSFALMPVEDHIVDFTASDSALVSGRNVVAVEVHQSSVASSDLSFDLSLAAERENTGGTNQAPRVTIVTPANNARFPIEANILLGANATVTTTSHVATVEFFANGVKIGNAGGPALTPAGSWLLTWSNAPAGEFTLTARATDTRGAVGFSLPIRIFVGTNTPPPGVGLFAADAWATEGGANGALDPGIFRFWREGPTHVPLTVFYSVGGDASNGLDYQTLGNSVVIPAGTSVVDVVVRALDDMLVEPTETVVLTLVANAAYRTGTANNPAATRATVNIIDNDPVVGNEPPTVRWTRPAEGDVFHTPVNIQLAAMADDPEGEHPLQVEFFANGQRLGPGQFVPGACITCPYYAFTWSTAPPGAHTLTARATDSRGASTTSAPLTVTVRDGASLHRELHAVGVYSGDVNGSSSRNHETGSVSVRVDRPDRHVTLVLSAYEPVVWNVTSSSDTTIEKVILGGYYRQTVTGLAPGVQVINRYYDEGQGTSDYLYMGYATNSVVFHRTLAKLCTLTGLDLSSFQGAYHGPAFTVDTQNDNETFQCDYPQPVDPSELPDLSFTVSFFDRGGSGLFHQNYTLAGPQNAVQLLPALRIVPDAGGRYYYGAESHRMWQFDSQTGASLEMDLGPSLPELSWPTGVGFDSQRNRVLLSSLGGEGFLYAYASAEESWSLISSLSNLDVNGIGYHAPNDSIYAIASTYEDYHPRVLYRFNANGQRAGQIQLPFMPFDFGTGGYETELVSVGEYLVLLLEPSPHFYSGNGQPRESRIYLIDPRNGQVWLTYRRPFLADTDGDGVPDDRDFCPHTAPGTLVDANGCPVGHGDTDGDGVADALDECPGTPPNSIVNAHGCSLTQLCPCDGSWTNHAQYVLCVIRHTWEFYRQNLITAEQRRAIVGEAVLSNCGRTANEPLCMHLLPQTTEECQRNGLAFILTGDVTGSYVIECSSDFVNWTPIQTESTAVTGQEILCPFSADAPRFYRLRLQ